MDEWDENSSNAVSSSYRNQLHLLKTSYLENNICIYKGEQQLLLISERTAHKTENFFTIFFKICF